MNMEDKIIIVGAFHEIVELCELCEKKIIGIIDDSVSDSFMGYTILGNDDDASRIYGLHPDCLIVISPDSLKVKQKLADYYNKVGFKFAKIISPRACVSKSAIIGQGVVIQSGVNISSSAVIGNFCKLNFNCNIMHDVIIGDYSVIAPNAVILGRSKIGAKTYVGACSVILPNTIIKESSNIKPCSLL